MVEKLSQKIIYNFFFLFERFYNLVWEPDVLKNQNFLVNVPIY